MNYGAIWMRELLAIGLVGIAACGGDGANMNDEVDAAAPGGDMDASSMPSGSCEEGGRATSDRYLPMDVGNEWSYQVIDEFAGGPPTSKFQWLDRDFVPEGLEESVILQVTQKPSGTTENWLRVQGDAVVRLKQQDFDALGNLERTSFYVPSRIRLEESPDRVVEGATWSEDWVRVVEDPNGVETKREVVSDQWSVLGVDVPCETGWGAELECLHVRRVRLAGGKSQKEYYFARGYGKVREEGGQTEILVGCNLN